MNYHIHMVVVSYSVLCVYLRLPAPSIAFNRPNISFLNRRYTKILLFAASDVTLFRLCFVTIKPSLMWSSWGTKCHCQSRIFHSGVAPMFLSLREALSSKGLTPAKQKEIQAALFSVSGESAVPALCHTGPSVWTDYKQMVSRKLSRHYRTCITFCLRLLIEQTGGD